MADIDATTAHLDRLIRCYRAHTLDMGGMDAIVSGAAVLIDEVKRLRAGGCARDQHTTQFCAEAVAKDAEIVRLRAELDDAHKSTAIHRALNERMAAVLGLTEPHVDPVLGEVWPSWHDMPEQVGRLRAELEEARRERLQVGLRAGFDVGALEAERDELRAEVQQRIAQGNALYDAIVRRLAPHFPAGSRDLEWDVLPGTLAALVRERDGARDRLNELTAPVADFNLAWLRQNGDPCCHCGVPLSKHSYEAHGFVESVPVEELLAREVVRLRTTRDELQAALARRDALDAAWNAGAAEARGRVTHDPSADPRGHMPPEFRADEEIAAAWLAGWVADAAIVRLAEVEQERDEILRALAAEQGRPAGAPSSRWHWCAPVSQWYVYDASRRAILVVSRDGELSRWVPGRGWRITHHGNMRIAMLMADAEDGCLT